MNEVNILVNQEKMYRLIKDAEGLILAVLCGGVGAYEVKLRLSSFEIENFENRGKEYLDDLAEIVSRNREKYRDRLL